jgi:two-component system cell cycle response regulator
VGNYRMLTERVSREVLRHLRHDRELALLAIDLDRFKQVNDEHGHHRGDEVLREVAATLLQNVRTHDIVVRHGGDEFAVVATETEPDEAMALAERLRDAICELSPDGMELGASIGVAHFPHDARTLDGLLVVADRNLRDVKADGRNAYRSRQLSRAII